MKCRNCDGNMTLQKRDAPGEAVHWYRCRVCDSGQMTSISHDEPPPAATRDRRLRIIDRWRAWRAR